MAALQRCLHQARAASSRLALANRLLTQRGAKTSSGSPRPTDHVAPGTATRPDSAGLQGPEGKGTADIATSDHEVSLGLPVPPGPPQMAMGRLPQAPARIETTVLPTTGVPVMVPKIAVTPSSGSAAASGAAGAAAGKRRLATHAAEAPTGAPNERRSVEQLRPNPDQADGPARDGGPTSSYAADIPVAHGGSEGSAAHEGPATGSSSGGRVGGAQAAEEKGKGLSGSALHPGSGDGAANIQPEPPGVGQA